MVCRYGQELPKSPVRMNAHYSNVLAVVVVPGAARRAFSTVQVRLDRTVVAGRYATVVGGHFHNFRSQFMPQHSWINEEWLSAVERVEIGATDAYTMNSQKRLARSRSALGDIACDETAGFFKYDLLHRDFLDSSAAWSAGYRRARTARKPSFRMSISRLVTSGEILSTSKGSRLCADRCASASRVKFNTDSRECSSLCRQRSR